MYPSTIQTAHWIIVTQVKSNRVVYFTDDADYEPPMEGDWYYISSYDGNLPVEMTLRNCWRWRFNGGIFNDAKVVTPKSSQQLLIEANRKALRGILREKMNALREPLLPKGSLGLVIREEKLAQAKAFLQAEPDTTSATQDFVLLQGVAAARGLTMHDAARLVVDKASETMRILRETEHQFEALALAIRSAKTQDDLLELRARLIGEIYPELSQRFKHKTANTTPVDRTKSMVPAARVNEVTRLRTLLRERVNHARKQTRVDYVGGEQLNSWCIEQARRVMAGVPNALDNPHVSLLQSRADTLGLPLVSAAKVVIEQAARFERLLIRTEIEKERLLSRIEVISSLREVDELEIEIRNLDWSENDNDNVQESTL